MRLPGSYQALASLVLRRWAAVRARPLAKDPMQPVSWHLRAAPAEDFTVAIRNAGMDTAASFPTDVDAARWKLAEKIMALADNCHFVGVSEMHTLHFEEAQVILGVHAQHLSCRGFSSHDAVIWRDRETDSQRQTDTQTEDTGGRSDWHLARPTVKGFDGQAAV